MSRFKRPWTALTFAGWIFLVCASSSEPSATEAETPGGLRSMTHLPSTVMRQRLETLGPSDQLEFARRAIKTRDSTAIEAVFTAAPGRYDEFLNCAEDAETKAGVVVVLLEMMGPNDQSFWPDPLKGGVWGSTILYHLAQQVSESAQFLGLPAIEAYDDIGTMADRRRLAALMRKRLENAEFIATVSAPMEPQIGNIESPLNSDGHRHKTNSQAAPASIAAGQPPPINAWLAAIAVVLISGAAAVWLLLRKRGGKAGP